MKIDFRDLDLIVFDFDGVLTDNSVYVDQFGVESVKCSRSDGLAFDILRKINIRTIILSTETNPIVQQRAKKLKIEAINSQTNKEGFLKKFCKDNLYSLDRVLYVGNDLNDYYAMKSAGYRLCPSDSHPKILEIATKVIDVKGGDGVVRNIVEEIFNLNMMDLMES